MPINRAQLAKMVDYSILKPDATEEDVRRVCGEAMNYHVATVCINPAWVGLVSDLLKGSDVKVNTVVDFPFGASTARAKSFEALDAIERGATELDMVINIGALKSGYLDLVRRGIERVVDVARTKETEVGETIIIKVIIETCYLTEREKRLASEIVKRVGADFVKTSTGYGSAGATADDVKLIREVVRLDVGVKASGGIRDCASALELIGAGATRIGTSVAVKILEECKE